MSLNSIKPSSAFEHNSINFGDNFSERSLFCSNAQFGAIKQAEVDKHDETSGIYRETLQGNNSKTIPHFNASTGASAPPEFNDESNEDNFSVVARRKRRRRRRNSITSLPASTVSAFSAFASSNRAAPDPPRRATLQLILNSSIMFGREFCYAVEAGLTTPILLSIGLPLHLYSLVWVISPILGFILQPILGNVSDRCRCPWGKRRPFILCMAILLLIGLTLFLNGEEVGLIFNPRIRRFSNQSDSSSIAAIVTIVTGVVIFDFSADFIEGPIRAYTMDICNEEDVKRSLLYQAVFTGAGGAFGYASGGVSWIRDTPLKKIFPSDRQVIYSACAFIFVVCCVFNLLSIPEENPNLLTGKRLKKRKHKTNVTAENKTQTPLEHSNSDKPRQTSSDVKQNHVERNRNFDATERNSDTETTLLNVLMRLNRNKLFDQYENLSTQKYYESNPPPYEKVVDQKLRKVTNGGVGKLFRKHKNKTKIAGSRRNEISFRKFEKTRSLPISETVTYGTFIPDQQIRLAESDQITSTFDRRLSRPWRVKQEPYFQNSTESQPISNSTTALLYDDQGFPVAQCPANYSKGILDARATHHKSTKEKRHNLHFQTSCSCESDVASSSSMSSISFGRTLSEHFPYAAVHPAFNELQLSPKITSSRTQKTENNALPSENKQDTFTHGLEDTVFSDVGSSVSRRGALVQEKNENYEKPPGGLKSLLRSIKSMPKELRILCVCHLLGWIAFASMALFFTDFVGQVVLLGDPRAPPNARAGELYKRGVEIGNWGLTINAVVSCSYCVLLRRLIRWFGSRSIYVFGYLSFCVGTCLIAAFPSTIVVLVLSSVMGIMSATLYTLPYMLVAQYHDKYKTWKGSVKERGIGTDCALVTCMIQLSQIITGLGVGALVNLIGTVTVTVATASVVGFLGALWAGLCVRY